MGKRQEQIHLRITEQEKQALEVEAKRVGVPMSTIVRNAVRTAIGLPSMPPTMQA